MTSEELRRVALESLSEYADPRARDALENGELVIAAGVSWWEGSHGHVEGHRVTLSLDAERLGRIRVSHAVVDALHAALAKAVATHPGEALLGLELRWARRAGHAVPRGYRDEPPGGEVTLEQALVAYLEGAGEAAVAHIVSGGATSADASSVSIVMAQDRLAALGAHPHAVAALTAAVRDLLADPRIEVAVES
jgi:hypothetical protein